MQTLFQGDVPSREDRERAEKFFHQPGSWSSPLVMVAGWTAFAFLFESRVFWTPRQGPNRFPLRIVWELIPPGLHIPAAALAISLSLAPLVYAITLYRRARAAGPEARVKIFKSTLRIAFSFQLFYALLWSVWMILHG